MAFPLPLPSEFPGDEVATPAITSLPGEFPWGVLGDSEISTAASETYRLAQYIKGKPNMEAILDALGVQAEDLAVAFSELNVDRRVSAAFGQQLDVLGAIVGEAREGDADDDYRARISAKILINNSSGGPEELYAIFDWVRPAGTVMQIQPWFPAGFVFLLSGAVVSEAEATRLSSILRRSRAAGVRGIFQWSQYLPADTFTFDGTAAQALDVGHFAGATL